MDECLEMQDDHSRPPSQSSPPTVGIFSRSKKTDVLGSGPPQRPYSSGSYSSGTHVNFSDAAAAAQDDETLKSNRVASGRSSPADAHWPGSHRPAHAAELLVPRHQPRAILLPLFLTVGLALIFLLFLPPWQLIDSLDKGVLNSFVSSPPSSCLLPSTTTTTVTSYHTPLSTSSSTEEPEPPKMSTERTFIAIKPDGVQRGLVGPILSRFENRG